MSEDSSRYEMFEVMDYVMKRILHLGQSSLSEHQFKSFRKLTMDFFQEGKRELEQGRRGGSETTAKEGCFMSG